MLGGQGTGLTGLLVLLALTWVPGSVIALGVLPGRRSRWVALAAAPALTLGMVGVLMGWLRLVGLPTGPMAVLVAEAVVCAVPLLARLVVRRRWGSVGSVPARLAEARLRGLRRLGASRTDLLGLGAALAVVVAWGYRMLGGLRTPPGWDAMNHGVLARAILQTGSSDPERVCVTGTELPAPACHFYPLAPHVLWDQAVLVSGSALSRVMLTWVLLVGPVMLAIGLYVLVRYLNAPPPVAAAAAALSAVAGPTWELLNSGRLTAQTGPAMVPAVALLVAVGARGPRAKRLAVLAGIAVAGLAQAHTYDVIPLTLLATGILLVLRLRRRHVRAIVGHIALMAAATALVLLPLLAGLGQAEGERAVGVPRFPGNPMATLQFWVFDARRWVPFAYTLVHGVPATLLAHPAVLVFAWTLGVSFALGVVASLLPERLGGTRWSRPFLLSWFGMAALAVWTGSATGSVRDAVANLWYGDLERLWWMNLGILGVLAVAGATLVGRALGGAVGVVRSRRAPQDDTTPASSAGTTIGGTVSRRLAPGLLVPVLVASVLVGLAAAPGSWQSMHRTLLDRTPVSDAYVRTSAWLEHHLRPHEIIAEDLHRDFVVWSYADRGTPLLLGLVPLDKNGLEDWHRRYRVWHWLVGDRVPDEKQDPPGCLVRHYNVRFVVVSDEHMPDGPRRYNVFQLADSRAVALVRRDGPLRVYEVTPAGRECPAPQPA